MKRFHDMTGMQFGRLTVLRRGESTKSGFMWVCLCECGNEKTALAGNIKHGRTTSCGCFHRERAVIANTKHGMGSRRRDNRKPTYRAWESMRGRCYRPKDASYKNYGARGIQICERWAKFENFLADMGKCPLGMELDRKDVNGNYEPTNCRWVSEKEQQRNKRNSRFVEFLGHSKTVAEWSEMFGISQNTLRGRLDRGWPMEKAIEQKG